MTTGNQKFMKSGGRIHFPKPKVRRRIEKRGMGCLWDIRQRNLANLARAENRRACRADAARRLAEQHAKK